MKVDHGPNSRSTCPDTYRASVVAFLSPIQDKSFLLGVSCDLLLPRVGQRRRFQPAPRRRQVILPASIFSLYGWLRGKGSSTYLSWGKEILASRFLLGGMKVEG